MSNIVEESFDTLAFLDYIEPSGKLSKHFKNRLHKPPTNMALEMPFELDWSELTIDQDDPTLVFDPAPFRGEWSMSSSESGH